MIYTLYARAATLLEHLLGRFYVLLCSNLALFSASVVLPLIYLIVAGAIDFQMSKWTLRVYSPPVPGLISVYRSTDDGFVRLTALEVNSCENGGFCTVFASPQLDKADLRILVPADSPIPQPVRVSAQFISADGGRCVDLPSTLVTTYSANKLGAESTGAPIVASTLPHLSSGPVSLPSHFPRATFLYWLLWWNCALVGILYFISATRGSGAAWAARFLISPTVLYWKEFWEKRLLLLMVLLNALFFVGVSIIFTQRYPVADDPMMAMIANGTLGSHPSEYLFFINVIIGLPLKALSTCSPVTPWYAFFIASTLIGASAVIGFSLIKLWGWRRGGATYAVAFVFYIFESFYQLQFTTAAAMLCLAGLSLALSETQRPGAVSIAPLSALLLLWLGSLVRYQSALLVLILAAPVLFLTAFHSRRFSILVFLLLSFAGITVLRDIDQAYYDASPDWKFFRQYNNARGALHGTSRFEEFKDNSSVYAKIGWTENDFQMISQNWLYQDLGVFSQKNLDYLNEHLVPPKDSSIGYLAFLRPMYKYLWMPFVVCACLLHYWLVGELTLAGLFSIGVPLFGLVYYLARVSHVPDHVFIPAMLEAFLLAVFLPNNKHRIRRNRFGLACFISLGLFLACFEFFSIRESSARDERRTVELNKALDKIAFLNDKVFQVTITSIRYEDLPPFENDNRLRSLNFIDGLWSYPSPDTLSVYQRNGIKVPLADLVAKDNFFLLIPTFNWDRVYEVQSFLRDHYKINSTYEVVKDPNGESCCYPNFSVLKFHPSSVPDLPGSHSQ